MRRGTHMLVLLAAVFALSAGALVTASTLHSTIVFPVRSVALRDAKGNDHARRVEVADTPSARERGLMGRKTAGEGMLFTFDAPQMLSFWMKNTIVPLDIAFFRDDGTFVSSQRMQPCVADPCRIYSSGAPSKYALEMNAGDVAKIGVGVGWSLHFPTQRSHGTK